METTSTRARSTATSLDPVSLLFPDFDAEQATTRRFLECFPEAHAAWRPHERSRTLAELATHVADIPNRGTAILTTQELNVGSRVPRTPLTTVAELVALHESAVGGLREALAAVTDLDALTGEWVLRAGPQVVMHGPKFAMLRTVMMSHLVHHRAQLGVYYRLLGVPVPGTYGPSADEMPRPAGG